MDCMQAASCLYLEMTIPISGGWMMMYRSLDAASIPLTCFGKCLWDGYVCRTILLYLSEKICQGCFLEEDICRTSTLCRNSKDATESPKSRPDILD